MQLQDIDCGEETKKSLESFSNKDQLVCLLPVQKCYKTAILHINSKIVNRTLLTYFGCISPKNIKNTDSTRHIVHIAKSLPLYNIDFNELNCEWKGLQLDEDISFVLKKNERIDVFWNRIFDLKIFNDIRYPNLTVVVKSTLSLPHGSSDVERGFSLSALHLTQKRTLMSEKTLNARLNISDGMKKFDNLAFKFPINDNLLKLGSTARRSYINYLEDERKKEEEEKNKKGIDEKEKAQNAEDIKNLKRDMKDLESLEKDLTEAKKLWQESSKNTDAMENIIKESSNPNLNIKVMQQLLSNLQKLKKTEKKLRENFDNLQEKIMKKNTIALKNAVSEKLKKNV